MRPDPSATCHMLRSAGGLRRVHPHMAVVKFGAARSLREPQKATIRYRCASGSLLRIASLRKRRNREAPATEWHRLWIFGREMYYPMSMGYDDIKLRQMLPEHDLSFLFRASRSKLPLAAASHPHAEARPRTVLGSVRWHPWNRGRPSAGKLPFYPSGRPNRSPRKFAMGDKSNAEPHP